MSPKPIRQQYQAIVDLLTLKQYVPLMGGDMSYKSKAERALKVSKSKKVQTLCAQLLKDLEKGENHEKESK